MVKQLTMPIHTQWFKGPLHYPNAEMLQVIFTPTANTVQQVLPKPLQPGLLAGIYISRFPTTPFGPMWEAGVMVQCTYQEHFGLFTISQYTDRDDSVAAHREIWGFPTKLAQFKWNRKGDHIKAEVIRNNVSLLSCEVDLEGPGEWIDTGAAINVKLIPSVDGKGYDVKQITAADLEFTIHDGLAGDGQLKFGKTKDEPLADLIQIENIVAGTLFKIDLTCPYGRVIGEVEL